MCMFLGCICTTNSAHSLHDVLLCALVREHCWRKSPSSRNCAKYPTYKPMKKNEGNSTVNFLPPFPSLSLIPCTVSSEKVIATTHPEIKCIHNARTFRDPTTHSLLTTLRRVLTNWRAHKSIQCVQSIQWCCVRCCVRSRSVVLCQLSNGC